MEDPDKYDQSSEQLNQIYEIWCEDVMMLLKQTLTLLERREC